MVDKEQSGLAKEIQDNIEEFVQEKQKDVIWKTEGGAKALASVVQYKIDNPHVSINTLCEYLIKKCGWNYSKRYIFDLIVQRVEARHDK